METETNYGIIEARKPNFPVRDLLRAPHNQGDLIVAYPAFGPDLFKNNIAEMKKFYSHPLTGERISFREPTTSESISASVYNFNTLAKPQIFDPRWLQIGRIIRTSEGVYVNPLKNTFDENGVNESLLKNMLDGAEKIKVKKGYIYLGENDFGFAEYGSFAQGVQESEEFAEAGLARVLEHTKGTAENLKEISSKENYSEGINVFEFDSVKQPILKIASLGSDWDFGGRLGVDGSSWYDGDYGCAFGVLD